MASFEGKVGAPCGTPAEGDRACHALAAQRVSGGMKGGDLRGDVSDDRLERQALELEAVVVSAVRGRSGNAASKGGDDARVLSAADRAEEEALYSQLTRGLAGGERWRR